jgi:hypothetical protein
LTNPFFIGIKWNIIPIMTGHGENIILVKSAIMGLSPDFGMHNHLTKSYTNKIVLAVDNDTISQV